MPRLQLPIATALLLTAALSTAACARGQLPAALASAPPDRSQTLFEWLAGDYSNHATALEAERLEIHVARLPDFGSAFYIEELAHGQPVPLRQYVWIIRPDDEGFVAEHWRLTDPANRVGAWRSPDSLQRITMYTLRHAPGCDVRFRWEGGFFVGISIGRDCTESLPGTLTCTTSLVLGPDGFSLRLAGFDARGRRVFGPSTHAWPWDRTVDAWKFERTAPSG